MAYRICTSFEMENGHMLSKRRDLCNFPCGDTRKIEFVLGTDDLDAHELMDDYLVRRRGGAVTGWVR